LRRVRRVRRRTARSAFHDPRAAQQPHRPSTRPSSVPVPCVACACAPVIWRRRGAKAGFASVEREACHPAGALHPYLPESRTTTYPAPHSAGALRPPNPKPDGRLGTAVCEPWHRRRCRHTLQTPILQTKRPAARTLAPNAEALFRMPIRSPREPGSDAKGKGKTRTV